MLRMHAVTCTHSLPSLSLELDPGTSGIGIDALTIVRSATVFHSLTDWIDCTVYDARGTVNC